MKKKLMAVLLAMLACMSASAQVKFGAKVGLDLTTFGERNADTIWCLTIRQA